MSAGAISLDRDTLRLAGGDVRLGIRGMRIVGALMRARGTLVPHGAMMDAVWPGVQQDDRLRHQLRQEVHQINGAGRDFGMSVLVSSAKGVGYCWSPTEAANDTADSGRVRFGAGMMRW